MLGVKAPLSVRVDFACNDDAGDFSGYVSGIQIAHGDILIDLEPVAGDRRLVVDAGGFLLAGKVFEHMGRIRWSGSLVWDGLWMTVDEAARMLVWLHRRRQRLFQMTTGESGLYRQWHDRVHFGGSHLHRHLIAVGHDQAGRRA